MNKLEVEISEENGLSFDLIVDGRPMAEHLNDGNEAIPYWLIVDGLPT